MFRRISDNSDDNVNYEVRASYLELYNEKLQDLLDPKTAKTIKIRESTTKGVYVENAFEEPVSKYEDIELLLNEGNKARTVAATKMNATSSRSHSILTIFFTRFEVLHTSIFFLIYLHLTSLILLESQWEKDSARCTCQSRRSCWLRTSVEDGSNRNTPC